MRLALIVSRSAEVAAVALFVAGAVGVWLAWWPAGCLLTAAGLVGLSWGASR